MPEKNDRQKNRFCKCSHLYGMGVGSFRVLFGDVFSNL